MSFDNEKVYNLLPAIYRIRDAEQGGTLKEFLAVIADQVAVLEESLAQLYDDQFVETCAPWVLPYIGDLLGIEGLRGDGPAMLSPRAEVANTIGYRRRKGTAAMFEQLAHDVTGWPARAVEFFQLLATTQFLNHLRPENRSFLEIRDAERLEALGGPFEHLSGNSDLTHTADVRLISSRRGRYNIPNIGIFLWRLQAFSVTRSPAVAAGPGGRRFVFSPLGNDMALFNRPRTEEEVTHLAEPINVPARISRRTLKRKLEQYYGSENSFLIELRSAGSAEDPVALSAAEIKVCDLSGWTYTPASKIAIDPVLGRIAFPDEQSNMDVLVSFYYGFSSNMGGGEYSRTDSFEAALEPILSVASTPTETYITIQSGLNALGTAGGVVEITDNGRYSESVAIDAGSESLELRAADGRRPALLLASEMTITGSEEASVTLNGLLIAGAGIRVSGNLGRLRLRHCTLVPGRGLTPAGKPTHPNAVSLIVDTAATAVEIENCVVGAMKTSEDAAVSIDGSIIDATAENGVAYEGIATDRPGAPLRIENSTVIGKVATSQMELASNTIFLAALAPTDNKKKWPGPVQARQRQEGCVRYSYIPPGSRVPRQYECQPGKPENATAVRPVLTSARYGDPAYCQLSAHCSSKIRRGADDESEMGAFHDLYQPQREDHLNARLQEYLRFGLEAGIFYET